mgnify:FL=1
MDELNLKALAKINIGLDVLRKREDGYHEVRMIMQTIHLFDRLHIKKTKEPGIQISSNLYYLPVNENNLIHKAAALLMDEFSITEGVEFRLEKHIPVAAGMAGGSTDAASTMFGVNRLFGLNLSMGKMMELGVRLGADVPYCVMRGTALAEGIGEKLTRITPVPHMWILIAKPQINVSTRLVYEQLDMGGIQKHPDIDGIIRAIEAQDVVRIAQSMGNVLENVTVPLYPVIETIKQDMLSHGAINAMMSGSGPTVFGIFPDEQTTLACQAFLKKKGDARQVYITENFN